MNTRTHTMPLSEFVLFMDSREPDDDLRPVTLDLNNAYAEVLGVKQLSTRVDLKLTLAPKGDTPDYEDTFLISLPWFFEITFTE